MVTWDIHHKDTKSTKYTEGIQFESDAMTIADFHALCLIALPIATIGLLWRLDTVRAKDSERVVTALVAAIAFVLFRMFVSPITGDPVVFQFLIPVGCMTAIILFLADWRIAAIAATAMWLIGAALVLQAWSIDSLQYRARSSYLTARFSGSVQRSFLSGVEALTRDRPAASQSEGWFEDVYPELRDGLPRQYLGSPSDKYGRHWHTWLTGLLEPVGVEYLGVWRRADGTFEVRDRSIPL